MTTLYYLLVLILLSLLTCKYSEGFVANHSFVFVSGWPQSGTSLVHQVLNAHDGVGSMIRMCEQILGEKRCVSFNHEGQWILPGHIRTRILAGQVCRVDRVDGKTKFGILSEVSIVAELS